MTDTAPVEVSLDGTDADVAEQIRGWIERVRAEPDRGPLRGSLGMAYDVGGLPAAALASYRQAEALDPEQNRWPYFQALILARRGDTAEALEALERALAIEPGYAPAWLHRGDWLVDLGRLDEAREAFARAEELDPDEAWPGIGLARVDLKLGRLDAAARRLEELSRRDDATPYVYQLLAEAYRRNGDLEAVRELGGRARPGPVPQFADPLNDAKVSFVTGFGAELRRAEALLYRGRRRQAIELLESLRRRRPDDETVLNNLSVAYTQAGQPAEAFRVLTEALEARPDYYPFHLNIASKYRQRGELDLALEHLDRAIELNPRLGFAYHQKGQILVEAGRKLEALEEFDQALAYDAANARAAFFAGLIESDLGEWDAAAARLGRATELEPELAPAWSALARAQLELGRFDAARRSIERAAALAGEATAVTELRRRLAEAAGQAP